ncbi:CDP-glycerol glycerophosphotransferase family protein [Phycicoccus sp. BSK3Z-2]|uniref:CDP-glycerol glycerophosphotransferase family protein n=1 Tax=Phycicoccus avicenniae TaxID=2828860 RepID=A0A941D9B9_9MICO|nr:CDP-glycerol glycerophosphotransferase family protein [Phycicoccus avicenniae]MBR7743478.1 CDP-glycerol glycerophosphotransferase family protein [Phycicoccus avicenniae]
MTLRHPATQEVLPDPGSLDLSVVLVASDDTLERVPEALAALQANPDLAGVPVTLVHGREVDTADWPLEDRVRRVLARSGSEQDLSDTVYDLLGSLGTRYVAASWWLTTAPDQGWATELAVEVVALEPLDLLPGAPLLVAGKHAARPLVARYVRDRLTEREVARDGDEGAYLGQLSLAAAQPLLESVDPHGTRIDVLMFLAAKTLPDLPEPPWRYRVVLTGPAGDVSSSPETRLEHRIDSKGVVRWEAFRAGIDLAGVRDGHYRLVVEVVSEREVLARRRNLRPRRGALISARTVRMDLPTSGGSARTLRYLLHTTRRGRRSFLTLQVGSGRRAAARWHATMLKKDASFVLRGRGNRRARLLRAVRLATLPLFARQEIWIVGERADTAQDNGLHLFRHLRTTHPEKKVYYVIDRESPQYARVRDLGNVVQHSSVRHQLLMLHASVLANAYSVRYLIPSHWAAATYTRHLVWRVGALRVYLKHGVHLSPTAVKRGTTGYDVCLTVTPGETEALKASSGYDEQLVEIGMPRYDALVPTPPSRTVLFMPTWRKYLVTKVLDGAQEGERAYEGSRYQRFMSGFLESPRLQQMLERYDYRLTFLPHYNMASKFVGAPVAGDRVAVADANTVAIQDAIRACDALVTDYSSVHFDVAYMGTPVVYVRFDEDEYDTLHASPSWFDHRTEGFGPVVEGLDASLDELEALLARDCAQDPVYAARVEAAFPYRDQGNCARTVAVVEEQLARIRR